MRKIFAFIATFFGSCLVSAVALAQEHGAATTGLDSSTKSVVAIASGLAITVAALGGAFSQSKAAVAALEGIARNPGAAGQVQTPMIIALALIESLVIYAFVMAILLWTKL